MNFNRTIHSPLVITAFYVLLTLPFISCVKQPGCIDPNAANYEFSAEKDDGSCLYDMHFWLNTARYNGVEIYVDGVYRDYINCLISGPPRCGVDDYSNGNLHCNALVSLVTGNHEVEVRAYDGTIFKETYHLPENCITILITDHD